MISKIQYYWLITHELFIRIQSLILVFLAVSTFTIEFNKKSEVSLMMLKLHNCEGIRVVQYMYTKKQMNKKSGLQKKSYTICQTSPQKSTSNTALFTAKTTGFILLIILFFKTLLDNFCCVYRVCLGFSLTKMVTSQGDALRGESPDYHRIAVRSGIRGLHSAM